MQHGILDWPQEQKKDISGKTGEEVKLIPHGPKPSL